jgi:isopenicillin N synthase-like dioxygenase
MAGIVPTLDVSGWDAGERDRVRIAAELDSAARSIGFVQVVGHGVHPDVCRAVRDAADAFFDLPLPERMLCRPARPDVNRGYAASGSESLSYSIGVESPPDLFEAFNIGVGAPPGPGDDPIVFAPNVWPADLPGFRDAFERYFAAARDVADGLTSIMARALGLPSGYFASRTDRSVDVLRANHYRRLPSDPAPLERQMRMGAHTDYGIVTVLLADPVPGLQVLGPGGQWHDVLPDPEGFVVNFGDATAIITNDQWRSTLHRVVPPGTGGEARRRSFAFFHDGNLDAVIEPVPSCCDAQRPPRYEPITLGEHVRRKLMGPRLMQEPDAVQTVGDRISPGS